MKTPLLGQLVLVRLVDTIPLQSNTGECREFKPHVLDFLTRACEGLDRQQSRQVENLLLKDQDLFAASSSELGKTGLVRHNINVGNAEPVKQRPR